MRRSRLIAVFNIWNGKLWQFSVKNVANLNMSAKHRNFDKIILWKREFSGFVGFLLLWGFLGFWYRKDF